MEILIPLLIAMLIFAIMCWVISLLPLPAAPIPIKPILYAIAAVVLIIYLLRFI